MKKYMDEKFAEIKAEMATKADIEKLRNELREEFQCELTKLTIQMAQVATKAEMALVATREEIQTVMERTEILE